MYKWIVLQTSSFQTVQHTHIHQQGPTNIYSHITTELTTHRCVLIDYFKNSNFSKLE